MRMTTRRRILPLLCLTLLVASALACAGRSTLTPLPSPTSGLATVTPGPGSAVPEPTETLPPGQPSATPQPAAGASPTPSPAPPTETPTKTPTPEPPAATSTPEPTRIRFEPGGVSATTEGHIAERGSDLYVLGALAGQTMEVLITSPAGDVLLTIWGADGVPLKRYVDGEAGWTGTLPETQDYIINAVSVGGETDYTLTVTIFPLEPEPARIEFGVGETAATVEGSLQAGETDQYVVRALANQGMLVSAISPGLKAVVGIKGADGGVLVGTEAGLSTAAVALLPRTQDYIISVVSTGGAVNYSLTIFITPLAALPLRIAFAPGADSATVEGDLILGGDFDVYALGASAGQTMEISVSSTGPGVGILVVGEDWSHWLAPAGEGSLTVSLPATQDYIITVSTAYGAGATHYSMEVTITGP